MVLNALIVFKTRDLFYFMVVYVVYNASYTAHLMAFVRGLFYAVNTCKNTLELRFGTRFWSTNLHFVCMLLLIIHYLACYY